MENINSFPLKIYSIRVEKNTNAKLYSFSRL